MSSYTYFYAENDDLVTFPINIWCFKVMNSGITQAIVQRRHPFPPIPYISTEGFLIPNENRISENKDSTPSSYLASSINDTLKEM